MRTMTAKKVLASILTRVTEYRRIDQPRGKVFLVKPSPKADLVAKVNEMVRLVEVLTADDVMNGAKPMKVEYAFLNEKATTADGFSFRVV